MHNFIFVDLYFIAYVVAKLLSFLYKLLKQRTPGNATKSDLSIKFIQQHNTTFIDISIKKNLNIHFGPLVY